VDAQGKIDAINIPPDSIKPVGFNADENVLPHSGRSFPGYLLLFEYFCFPEKFLFFDLTRLDLLKSKTFNDTLEIWINLNRFVKSDLVIDEDTFCLHATPVINLFRRIAEPIRIEHQKTDYRVVPDLRRQTATEIYSIDRVKATLRGSPGREMEYKPFYSNQHHLDQEDSQEGSVFWHMQRRPSGRKGDSGTDVYLSFTGSNFKPVDPGVEILTVYTTCTNRNLPRRLLFGDAAGDFDLEIEAPVERINCIIKPTHTRRPQLGGELQWRLISHLSLNYMSLVQGGEAALKEILKLYDFDNTPATRQQIEGIVSLQSRHVTKRMGQSFCRGVEVTLELDESKFVGAGLFLFESVLERFIAQYVSVNSFSQLVVKTLQQKGILKKWPPRSGNQILL
jgi:type VI secretion system protein ImpG